MTIQTSHTKSKFTQVNKKQLGNIFGGIMCTEIDYDFGYTGLFEEAKGTTGNYIQKEGTIYSTRRK